MSLKDIVREALVHFSKIFELQILIIFLPIN